MDMPVFLQNTPVVDLITLAVIILSVLIGIFRGFIREALDLASWIAAFAVAVLFVEPVGELLTPYVAAPHARTFLAGGGLFLGTLIVGGLISFVIGYFIRRTGLSLTDSLLGMAFGLGRGAALMVALALVVGLTPLPQTPYWQSAQATPLLTLAALQVVALMPPEVAKEFNFTDTATNEATAAESISAAVEALESGIPATDSTETPVEAVPPAPAAPPVPPSGQ